MKIKTKSYVHHHVVDEYDYQELEPNKIYEVIGLDHESYRIINDIGEPILYPKALFDVVETIIPDTWVKEEYGEDEYYLDPPELSKPGFYEDYFDGKPEAIKRFQEFVDSMEFREQEPEEHRDS